MKLTKLTKNPLAHDTDLLLLHGYGSDSQSWVATAPGLLEFGRVWTLDLPGHGKSEILDDDVSISDLANGIINVLEQNNLNAVHLVGHSLGGRIAMQIAQNEPQRVLSLALLSPAGLNGWINESFLLDFARATDESTLLALLQRLVQDERMIVPTLAQQVLKKLATPGVRQSLERLSQALVHAGGDIHSTVGALAMSSIPCKLIWGREDRINPPDPKAMAALTSNSNVMDMCGHLPHLEKRVVVNKLLGDFYRELHS